jgi:hypothetical protein
MTPTTGTSASEARAIGTWCTIARSSVAKIAAARRHGRPSQAIDSP